MEGKGTLNILLPFALEIVLNSNLDSDVKLLIAEKGNWAHPILQEKAALEILSPDGAPQLPLGESLGIRLESFPQIRGGTPPWHGHGFPVGCKTSDSCFHTIQAQFELWTASLHLQELRICSDDISWDSCT